MNTIATEQDIETLTTDYIQAKKVDKSTGDTYLKYLIGTVQAEIPVDDLENKSKHFDVLEIVSGRFYAVVLRCLPNDVDAEEKNRLSNWARSSKSTLKRWMLEEGNNIITLDPGSTSKRQLIAAVPRGELRPLTLPVFERRAEALASQIEALTERIADKQKQSAAKALEDVLQRVIGLLAKLGVQETKSPKVALETGMLLRAPAGLFFPVPSTNGNGAHANG